MALAYKRKFGGKVYTLRTSCHYKAKAKEIASDIRKAGKDARVVKQSVGGYAVYAR